MVPNHDLEIVLTINATQLQSGQWLNVSAYDVNTTTHEYAQLSSLTTTFNFSAPTAKIPCGPRPTVFSVYSGIYSSQNVSQASPLQVFWPGGESCPAAGFPSFVSIQPINGYYFTTTCTDSTNSTFCPQFIDFPEGTYTVAALDLYGGMSLLYFKVGN
jgi:hypothetical protein